MISTATNLEKYLWHILICIGGMRYVFQIFSTVITIVLDNGERLFYHISEQANRILELLGDKYQKTYGS